MSKGIRVPARHSERRNFTFDLCPIGGKGRVLRSLQASSGMGEPMRLHEGEVMAYVPNVRAVYLVLVPQRNGLYVRYVGKSTRLRTRFSEHLDRYRGAWVCWRYERDDDALYAAECCEYWKYGGKAVLDNRRDPERPHASRLPRCSDLACPVPRRAFAPRAY